MNDEDRYTRITLRIPKELHAVLTREAERTSKSLNAQIVESLTRGLESTDQLESLKEAVLKLEIRNAKLLDEIGVARRQTDKYKSDAARVEQLELQRADSERITRLLMRLITQGFRILLREPSPSTLAHPDVDLGRALLQKIDAGGLGVAKMLATSVPEDPSLQALLKLIAEDEAANNKTLPSSTG